MFITDFTLSLPAFGQLQIRPVSAQDAADTWHWATQSYAQFWGMQDYSQHDFIAFYEQFTHARDKQACMVELDGQPAALIELYQPATDPVGQTYPVAKQDLGMHILLSPNTRPVRHFSFQVMRCVLAGIFDANPDARIIVEPDIRNHKIHRLNKRLGFTHHQQIMLGDKQAYLGMCKKADFDHAVSAFERLQQCPATTLNQQPQDAAAPLISRHWDAANRDLIIKAITEFTHERLLSPEQTGADTFTLRSPDYTVTFKATWLALEHLAVQPDSLCYFGADNTLCAADAPAFIVAFSAALGLQGEALAVYLEELQSTLLSSCFKRDRHNLSARELVDADFQTLEGAMTEGHPAFIANNGRIGFTPADYRLYAPEASRPVQLLWIAVSKQVAAFNEGQQQSGFDELMQSELDLSLRDQFTATLQAAVSDWQDYYLMPVHPWQWYNKLVHLFAAEIACRRLVFLGQGDDYYLPQQSIRTFYNISHPHKNYVKVALSIQNMGFMRGLSAGYMEVTPAINDWASDLVSSDSTLQQYGFRLLKEHSAMGYYHPLYETAAVGNTPYKKMLASLWRENPSALIASDERLMTMAGLLHTDYEGNSLAGQLIEASGLSAAQWLAHYFNAYCIPLVHCLYAHKLVFMPHGENLILVLKNHTPVRVFMKDIGEEVALLNSTTQVPEAVSRIHISMPPEKELLSIFTDVFDCIFRYLVALLVRENRITEAGFWEVLARCITEYQQAHPHLCDQFAQQDIFAETFAHSCLNRLQLGNSKQMVDLADPAGSLMFAGELENPLALFTRRHAVA